MSLSHQRRVIALERWLEKNTPPFKNPFESLVFFISVGNFARLFLRWMTDPVVAAGYPYEMPEKGIYPPRPTLREGQSLLQWEAAVLGYPEQDWAGCRKEIPADSDMAKLLREIELSLSPDYRASDLALFLSDLGIK